MGLNEFYEGMKTQILITKPLPSLNEVFSTIQQEEKRKKIFMESIPNRVYLLISKKTNKIGKTTNPNKESTTVHTIR